LKNASRYFEKDDGWDFAQPAYHVNMERFRKRAEQIIIKLEDTMIVRMWHGRVPASKADAYREFLNQRAIPDYQSIRGNISVHILQRNEGDVTHFITMTFWESLEVIKSFAGEEVEVAKYYPEDKDFLLEFEPTVTHYEVVGQS